MALRKTSGWTQALSAALANWGRAGVVSIAALSVCNVSRAQAPASAAAGEVTRSFLNNPLIHLPIEIEDNYRTQINGLVLYAKEGANGAWSIRDKAAPLQTSFTFKAPRDAEYWFRIVAIDKQGRSHPDDLAKDPQDAVVVVVDTLAPGLDVAYLGNAPEGQILQCDIRDANPDIFKMRFYYQTRDNVWRTLESLPDQPNTYVVPAQAALTNFIRVVAVDLAGNTTARTMNLSELAATAPKTRPTPAPTPAVQQAANPAPVAMPQALAPTVPTPGIMPQAAPQAMPQVIPQAMPQVAATLPTPAPTTRATMIASPAIASPVIVEAPVLDEPRVPQPQPINLIPNASKTPVAPVMANSGPSLDVPPSIKPATAVVESTSGTLAKPAPMPNLQLVGTTQVFLNYAVENVGVSGVGKMQIYATRDRGQSWQKVGEENQGKNPAEVNLPGEGVYGLKSIVSNGRGFGAQPPQAGDPADWWIEVDTTKPKVTITGIRPGDAHEAGSVHVFWQAEDKNLNAEAIELYYAPSREGPWAPIGKNLKNTGSHRWMPPAEAGAHAFIRLLARDKAGNIGLSETTQPIPLDDLSRPRIRLITVTPSPATSSSSNGNGVIQPVQATNSAADAAYRMPPAQHTTSSLGVEVR
jgi:hypothetical protein